MHGLDIVIQGEINLHKLKQIGPRASQPQRPAATSSAALLLGLSPSLIITCAPVCTVCRVLNGRILKIITACRPLFQFRDLVYVNRIRRSVGLAARLSVCQSTSRHIQF